MDQGAGPSASTKPQSEEALQEANQKFDQGIAAIKADEFEKAVQMFGDVITIRAAHYGELAPECAMAYYRYGSALLYQAQESADVFGGPVGQQAVQEVDKENSGAEPEAPTAPVAADDKGKAPADDTTEEEEPAAAVGEEENAAVEGDLQLAWENLETARAIWARAPEDHIADLAEVHSLLAEVNMENEAFDDALADLDAAIKYRSTLADAADTSMDRIMADLQFRRCLVLQFLEKPADALASVKDAFATLERRKNSMKDVAAAVEKGEEEKAKAAKEVQELTAFLDDLHDKIEELQDVIKEDEATRAAVRTAMAQIAQAAQPKLQDASAGGLTSANGAAKPSSNVTSPVKDLGVVGRGTKRINLAPTAAPTAAPASNAAEPAAKRTRALEDLMGGAGGDTTFGFGSAADAEEKKDVPAVPAFLQAASVEKVYTSAEKKAAE